MVGYGWTQYGFLLNRLLAFQPDRFRPRSKIWPAGKTHLKKLDPREKHWKLIQTTFIGRIWVDPIWFTTKLVTAFLTRWFSTAVNVNQAVKFTFKTPFNIKTTFDGWKWTNPIWLTTKPNMNFLTRWFSAAVNVYQAVKYTLKTPFNIETTFHGSKWTNPIWLTTKPNMDFLTRCFSTAAEKLTSR